jgi:hypothetical protein
MPEKRHCGSLISESTANKIAAKPTTTAAHRKHLVSHGHAAARVIANAKTKCRLAGS